MRVFTYITWLFLLNYNRCMLGFAEVIGAKIQMDQYSKDIDVTRWLSYQQIERGLMGHEFVPPRIVVSIS